MSIGLKRGTVALRPHEPLWEKAATETIQELKRLFGSVAVDVQHVGSTAVRRLAAKPILDIAVAVTDLADVEPLYPVLEHRGFIHRPKNDDEGERFFICGDLAADVVTHHIHIVKAGGARWRDYCNFRDYLNAHPEEVWTYGEIKCRLAARYPADRRAYTEGKAAYIIRALTRAQAWSYLGRTLTVQIDRPIGYVHRKADRTLTYPVNYGYVPGVAGGDGEELDVYVLGVDAPLTQFTGRVIGVAYRDDDVEDKLIAAPEGVRLSQAQIAAAVAFQETYYHTHIEPLFHRSCGAVIYRRRGDRLEYLLLHERRADGWSFPKGHMEAGETERETARREVREEAGFTPVFCEGFHEEITYPILPVGEKTVVFFLAEYDGEVYLPEEEITAYRWVEKDEGKALLRHAALTTLLDRAEEKAAKIEG